MRAQLHDSAQFAALASRSASCFCCVAPIRPAVWACTGPWECTQRLRLRVRLLGQRVRRSLSAPAGSSSTPQVRSVSCRGGSVSARGGLVIRWRDLVSCCGRLVSACSLQCKRPWRVRQLPWWACHCLYHVCDHTHLHCQRADWLCQRADWLRNRAQLGGGCVRRAVRTEKAPNPASSGARVRRLLLRL